MVFGKPIYNYVLRRKNRIMVKLLYKRKVREMEVLSKPIELDFEVKKEQTKQFLENSKESMLNKALTRAAICKTNLIKRR